MNKTSRKTKRFQRLAQEDSLIEHDTFDDETHSISDAIQPAIEGYSDAKNQLLEMIELGYEDLDIMVALNEKFDRALVDVVLDDSRKRGIF